ncbi:hypothetical protein GCM10027160_46580 [Streptomyces calidiresistens]|uniref:Uncharacterized protein n=1 Tax=Streptomyces calidiresistens TaxID=1485586 RepID=A0A7W3T1K7_9ACTN|nr:hypothetical protein [Streptomyces calidiresistens]MBB0228956.1 hypothetical protein [Streptomyces calidiresistens]
MSAQTTRPARGETRPRLPWWGLLAPAAAFTGLLVLLLTGSDPAAAAEMPRPLPLLLEHLIVALLRS